MIKFTPDMDEDGVPATHDQRNVRLKGREVRRTSDNPRRVEMRFVMVDPDEWPLQREGQSLTRLEPGQQCVGKTGPLCRGDCINLRGLNGRRV